MKQIEVTSKYIQGGTRTKELVLVRTWKGVLRNGNAIDAMSVFNTSIDHQSSKIIEKKVKLKCEHCGKCFCNRELLEKHHRTIKYPVPKLQDLDQKIQPYTGYGDAIYQATLLGKSSEVSNWEKKGLTWKVINIPINHNFTYCDLLKWLNEIYLENKEGFKLSLGFGFVLFQPIKRI